MGKKWDSICHHLKWWQKCTMCTLYKRRESSQKLFNSVISVHVVDNSVISVHVGIKSVISVKIPSIPKYSSEEEQLADLCPNEAISFHGIITTGYSMRCIEAGNKDMPGNEMWLVESRKMAAPRRQYDSTQKAKWPRPCRIDVRSSWIGDWSRHQKQSTVLEHDLLEI